MDKSNTLPFWIIPEFYILDHLGTFTPHSNRYHGNPPDSLPLSRVTQALLLYTPGYARERERERDRGHTKFHTGQLAVMQVTMSS